MVVGELWLAIRVLVVGDWGMVNGSRACGTRHRMGGTRFRVLTRGLVIGEL